MARKRNPLGDPVRIQRKGRKWGIRYYPTELIGDPSERVWLDQLWEEDTPMAIIEDAAARLRAELVAHRSKFGVGTIDEIDSVTVAEAVEAFIKDLHTPANGNPPPPTGTVKTLESRLRHNLCRTHGSVSIGELATYADEIVKAIDITPARGKDRPRGASSRDNIASAFAAFGEWFATKYRLQDPFSQPLSARTAGAPVRRRQAAIRDVYRDDPFAEENADQGGIEAIDPRSIPTPEHIAHFRRAIYRRETGTIPDRPTTGKGSRGGSPRLDEREAWRVSSAVPFTAATGVRLCETLAVHTSRIRIDRGIIRVDRQLDRYAEFPANGVPPLVPPKHSKRRDVPIWPEFLPQLQELIDYADEHHDGWLFYPTRDQTWWADGFGNMLTRAKDLLAWEFEQHADGDNTPLRWPYRFHDLRHFYASHALAPVDKGGLGWSVHFTSLALGHRSTETTERVYRHIINGEWEAVRSSRQVVLGLDCFAGVH